MKQFGRTTLLVLALLAIWQALYLTVGETALASPLITAAKLAQLFRTPSFWGHVAETGHAFTYALMLSLLGGIGLGVLLGVNRTSGTVAEPILIALYSVPKVTLYPLVLLCFGLGVSAKVTFGVMHGLIPITIFTMNAIRQMKPVYLRTSKVLRLTPVQTAATIVLPAILPEVMSGTRLGFSLTLLGVLIGEMFASRRGLGFLITNAIGLGDIATIIAGLTPDVDWSLTGRRQDYPLFGAWKGSGEVQKFFQGVGQLQETLEFSPREFIAADDHVVALGHYSWKIRKTGRTVAVDWVHVFTIRGGKVAKFREFTDTAQFAEAYRA